jgi:hypothetical protein
MVGSSYRFRLEAIVRDRYAAQKHVWRAASFASDSRHRRVSDPAMSGLHSGSGVGDGIG